MSNNEIFVHDGHEFEIQTAIADRRYYVKVLLNGEVVSPTYSVDFETHADYFSQYQESRIDKLKEIAKSDIKQGIYFKP